jgi:hypothetical protein
MDSQFYPHLLDQVAQYAADMYAAAPHCNQRQWATSTLGLRATCRRMHERFDARLSLHLAWKDGEWLTPGLRRIPAAKRLADTKCTATSSRLAEQAALEAFTELVRKLQAGTRVLDMHSSPDPSFVVPYGLELVRSKISDVPNVEMRTYVGRLDPSARTTHRLPRAPRIVLRLPHSLLFGEGTLARLRLGLRELVLLVDSPTDTPIYANPGRSDDRSRILSGPLARYDPALPPRLLMGLMREWFVAGGRVTLVMRGEVTRSLHADVTRILKGAARFTQASFRVSVAGDVDADGLQGLVEEAWDMMHADEPALECKGDVVVCEWDEWVRSARDVELDWLDPESVQGESGGWGSWLTAGTVAPPLPLANIDHEDTPENLDMVEDMVGYDADDEGGS